MRRKKLFLMLVIIATFFGCSEEDDKKTNFLYELVTIQDAVFPEEFIEGEVYTILVSYFRPTDCHSFSGFDFTTSKNKRTIAVVNLVVDNNDCSDLEKTDLIEVSFDFQVGSENSYIFEFWEGRDENRENQFFTIEIPVVKS
ncbi:hypothetical protein [Aquimarina pacifica]|uniref:hypothetical protein n=1 Tax=Aquimarina pacifica TaxID=1296415 RepID=UPI00046F14D1|nr:hypothetical protein [Aquimarina pacifica]